MQGLWSVFCNSLSLSSAYRLKKGYLEDSAAFAHAAQARYPPLLEDVQIIERPTFEAKEEAPKNNPGMLGSIAETISWLMTATWHLEPNFCHLSLCWGELCSFQDICACIISESKPNQ